MEIKHLIDLISELTPNMQCKYVRGDDVCTFVKIDKNEQRLYTKTPLGEEFSFAQSFIAALAEKIEENVPFNTSQVLNNKGSNRAVIDSIIAHTSEFYWLQQGKSKFTVWIPSKPHKSGELVEWTETDIFDNTFGSQNPMSKSSEKMGDSNNAQNNIYLTALRTKPFILLAGISGTGKSRIVRKLAQASVTEELQRKYDPKSVAKGFNRWELHKPANFELIQVKPNWHNSLEVVGYKSNIGGAHYEYTPFVEFVARAWKEPEVPFFLCLDEMNLAPVEQYFAEFLSAIESRSFENGEYETDPIIKPFVDFGEEVCNMMINHLVGKVDASKVIPDSIESKLVERFKTKGLTLPKNLLVLGTVNMDETTFSFSRKVLDRAMSVVMNEVEYDKFFSGESENDVVEMDDNTRKLLIDRPIRGLEATDNEAKKVEEYLTNINEVLEDTPFKLGYRAANEALLYVSAAHKFNPEVDIYAALDEFTMMKILSRIEGDKRSIGNLLNDLQEVITAEYPKSNEKLGKMAETLKNKQFVSYWT